MRKIQKQCDIKDIRQPKEGDVTEDDNNDPTSGVETTKGRGGSRQQAGVSRWCTELRGLSINVLGVIRVMWGSKQSSLPSRSHVRGVSCCSSGQARLSPN